MNKRLFLTRWIGALAGLVQGDTLTHDRWRWLKPRLPRTRNGETLLDVGCGTGAFTIGAALRGYAALGLTWDDADRDTARAKAEIIGTQGGRFERCDVRQLDQRTDLVGAFDIVLCCENIEHIIDDVRLAMAMHGCLKPGGRLLLTTPNYFYRAITPSDMGPFRKVEDGWHVRRGYTRTALEDVLTQAGFRLEAVEYCSGFFSQKTTWVVRQFRGRAYVIGWALTFGLRPLIPVLDFLHRKVSSYPQFSICVEAYKPRVRTSGHRPTA